MKINSKRQGRAYEFEVVDKIPKGYRVWGISREDMKGYLPICQVYPGTLHVVRETLMAVQMPEPDAELLADVAMRYGICDLQRAEKYIGSGHRNRRVVNAAIRLLEKYSE